MRVCIGADGSVSSLLVSVETFSLCKPFATGVTGIAHVHVYT